MKHVFKLEKGLYIIGSFIAVLGILFVLIRSDYVLKLPLFTESSVSAIRTHSIDPTKDGAIDSFLIIDSKKETRLSASLQTRLEGIGKRVTVSSIEKLTSLTEATAVIIATERLDLLRDRDIILNYVAQGGTVFFATRPSPSPRFMEMYRHVGLIEVGNFVETTGIELMNPFFGASDYQTFDAEELINSSLSVRLDPSATLLARSSQDVPLLWQTDYEAGRFVFFNGTMMEDPSEHALFFVGLTETDPMLRPVLNSKITTLHGFPFHSSDEKNISSSMTDRDYYRNIFWAELQRIEAKYDLNYVMATASPSLNPQLETSAYSEDLALYGRETLRSGGEVAIISVPEKQQKNWYKANRQQLQYALPGLTVKTVLVSSPLDETPLNKSFSDVTVTLGGTRFPTGQTNRLRLPSSPSDFTNIDLTKWYEFNELVSSGLVSTQVTPQTVTSEEDGERFLSSFKKSQEMQQREVPWLRTMKASDTVENHHFFNGSIYTKQTGDTYTFTLDESSGDTFFYFTTPTPVADYEDCQLESIGPGLYLVKSESLSFTIQLEETI
ncbi:DUF2194 domain-containing protein [Exiguobacterium sp. SH3S1]|uniref:DUF2194 domain-containing protein n=1 Tax=Exiguobacterium sp. SH3S1 TaxID=2510955 RepID=UPI00103A9D5D|nr:DUF2194 domain-containing protein [Exiguobacterium sp. SH3S1]TCI64070.1 DUF2194 domain-containing protein [Exiguobacterium sp. SH3S1]